ncbi:serine hydrolase domain-containing protein [Aquimarina sp. 2201CG5-10]|uniref:serine hydrolase domain-containing protein n=1 Tax=Aquimarina callyspongiae TaxID=3098150 RepID=UPI002AB460C8|nr:serine hydrolase domain-containing protein [Aquimarina sp. 2201CG5-10]MDY8137491.1 serine hydrolase domain-containing protein [Aquimarina sp. 2201CG5-10]
MNKHLWALLAFFIISSTSTAQEKKEKFLNELKQEVQKEKIPGCGVVVIKNGQVVISESLGMSDFAFSVPVDSTTIFSINSLSKIFAGTAIMQLVENEKINLSNPISDYLGDLPIKWQKITLRQLLSHTSGLPDIEDTKNGGLIGGKGEIFALEKVKNENIRFKAGEKFDYIQTNYVLILKLIEKISGMTYLQFLQENQFDKIGINKEIVFGSSFEIVQNKSSTYSYYQKNKLTNKYEKGEKLFEISEDFSPLVWADAGAFATTYALTKWIIALENEVFITKRSIEEMWTAVPLNSNQYGGFGGFLNGYGYGWPVIMRENHSAVAPIGGGRASLIVYPKDKLTIILLTNLTGSSPQKIIEKIAYHYWE